MIDFITINPICDRTQRCSNNYINITQTAESLKIQQQSYGILCRSYNDTSITVCTNCYTTLTAQRLGTESLLNPKDVLLEGNCLWPKHVAVRLNYVQTYVCVVVVCVLGSSIRHVFVWLCFTRLGGPQTRSGRFGKEGIFANDRSRIPNSQYYADWATGTTIGSVQVRVNYSNDFHDFKKIKDSITRMLLKGSL